MSENTEEKPEPVESPETAGEADAESKVESLSDHRELKEAQRELKIKDFELKEARAKLLDFETRFAEARGFVKKLESEVVDIRTRSERDAQKKVDAKVAEFAQRVLPIMDLLDLSLASVPQAQDSVASFIEGIRLIASQMQSALTEIGVIKINVVGETFDPHRHEAVMSEVVIDQNQDGVVTKELKAGYVLGDRVIRAAQVAVGTFSGS
jgi:molecular chaperone GrpE